MNLADFKKTGDTRSPRFVARVGDVGGTGEFELTLAGPAALVKRVLADATIELTIDSGRSPDQLMQDFEPTREQQRKAMWAVAALDDIDGLLKPDPGPVQRKTAVFAAIRPVEGTGTPFAFTLSGFFLGAGASLFLFGTWAIAATATVVPASGDQDLFLRLFTPTGPVVSAGRAGGTATDVVAFGFPLFPFVPCFQVFGFATGICGTFSAFGA